MARELRVEDYVLVPIEKLTTPKSGSAEILIDRWWLVVDGQLAFFRGRSPQCNSNPAIVERFARSFPFEYEMRQIPAVYVPTRHFEVHGTDRDGTPYSEADWKYVLPTTEGS